MATNSEVVSLIQNTLKFTNRDERVSRRFILNSLRTTAKTLISQKMLDRTLYRETNLFSKINCFDFKKDEVIKCPIIEFKRCDILMKSIHKLPEPVFSRLGAAIYEITSVDDSFELKLATPSQYRRNKNRKYKIDGEVTIYLGSDGYLYIPDNEVYSVNVTLLTLETDKLEQCSSCSFDKCLSIWEQEFICPDKLLEAVVDKTIQKLSITRNIVQDETPNNVERK